jgi:hypothetical protein
MESEPKSFGVFAGSDLAKAVQNLKSKDEENEDDKKVCRVLSFDEPLDLQSSQSSQSPRAFLVLGFLLGRFTGRP